MTRDISSPLDEAIRFAEEYGFNRGQEARDETRRLRKEAKEGRRWERLYGETMGRIERSGG